MHGFGVFFMKELREILRTWRIWVLPLIILGMAILSPVTAQITPALLESVAGGQTGVTIEIPDPSTIDAYLQWTKNLTQIVLIAVVISMAGTLSGERKSGTAILVLTKPVSRSAMVVAKVLSNLVLLSAATTVGAAACWGMTQVFFDRALTSEFIAATGIWLVLAALFVCVITLLSALIDSQAGVAGLGLLVYLAVGILSNWGPARDFSPAGLLTAQNLALSGQAESLIWPIVSAVGVGVLAVVAATLGFSRREL